MSTARNRDSPYTDSLSSCRRLGRPSHSVARGSGVRINEDAGRGGIPAEPARFKGPACLRCAARSRSVAAALPSPWKSRCRTVRPSFPRYPGRQEQSPSQTRPQPLVWSKRRCPGGRHPDDARPACSCPSPGSTRSFDRCRDLRCRGHRRHTLYRTKRRRLNGTGPRKRGRGLIARPPPCIGRPDSRHFGTRGCGRRRIAREYVGSSPQDCPCLRLGNRTRRKPSHP